MNKETFNNYFKKIAKTYRTGEATELTYRYDFQNFIESLFSELKLSEENKGIKKIGRPDYTCFKKSKIKVGYIETKNIGIDLNKERKGEQIEKYYEGAIPNIILTDYMRFILISKRANKEDIVLDVKLFDQHELTKDKKIFDEKTINDFKKLFEIFLGYSLPTIKKPTELAIQLSKRAKLLRDLAREQLEEDLQKIKNKEEPDSTIYDFYGAFRELIKETSVSECVDAYAQTITYGLFLSKVGSQDGLSRDSAVTYIPSNISIIKKIFMNITGDALPKDLSWIVDEIIDVLNASDIKKILSEFVFEGKNYKDPFIHFYEDFLKEYDPEKRKRLGIYYTPEPIVSFITNSINQILKKEFGKTSGFADDSVTVLDPATGTGTFLANAFVIALNEIRNKGLTGIEKDKIKNHLLKHFYAFEILVSPYVISHLKLSTLLKKEGYDLKDDDRVQIYLTDTLDPSEITHHLGAFFKELSQENIIANKIKTQEKILVVMGNPPYSSSKVKPSDFIKNKLNVYLTGLGVEKEKKKGVMQDDYIRFIRFSSWKIENNRIGIIGLITNNSYLDGKIHRAMRKDLLNKFDKIYILNLHGNSRIGETCPDGSKDKNVFDIQQGVCISFLIKTDEKTKNNKIKYFDLFGLREDKYKFLESNNINSIDWSEFEPLGNNFFFVIKDFSDFDKYKKFKKLDEIFNKYSSGVETKRDHFAIDFDKDTLKDRINEFIKTNEKEDIILTKFKLSKKSDLNVKKAQEYLIKETNKIGDFIKKYSYRPFDNRYIFYHEKIVSRHRKAIMENLNKKNVALNVTKQLKLGHKFQHIIVTDLISDRILLSNTTSEASFVFPLFLYVDNIKINDKINEKQKTLLGGEMSVEKKYQDNFTDEFKQYIKEKYPKKEINPEEIMGYMYAVLHSLKYRKKYEEFLKIDFPRIPFVNDYKTFKRLSELGNELIELHLMKKNFSKNEAKFEVSGTNEVDFVKYEGNKVKINEKQYFGNIKKEIWDFYIGGYKVLDKWLKSRKGRKLDYNEVETFIKITNILSETTKLMNKIDKIKIN